MKYYETTVEELVGKEFEHIKDSNNWFCGTCNMKSVAIPIGKLRLHDFCKVCNQRVYEKHTGNSTWVLEPHNCVPSPQYLLDRIIKLESHIEDLQNLILKQVTNEKLGTL